MNTVPLAETGLNLTDLLDSAKNDDVVFQRENGDTYMLKFLAEKQKKLPPALKLDLTRDEIVAFVRETRDRV